MLKPDINLGVRVPLNIDSDQSGRQNTQSVQTPQVEMSDTEKETKLNQIINDIQRGNISVDEAKSALEELGIIPEVTTEGNKTVFTFEFKGKKYTVNQNNTTAGVRRILPQNRGVQSLLTGVGNDTDTVSWLALDQHVLLSANNVQINSAPAKAPAVKADSTQSAGGTKGSGSTSGSGGVVSADGTQSAGGATGSGGTSGVSGTDSTSGTNGVVQADGTTSVSGASGTGSVDGVETSTNVGNSYTLDDLKNTYKFTDQDINTFFEKQNDKYVIRQSAIKNCFGREDITTVSQLLDAMKNDGFSEGYVRGAYSFSQEQADKYLTLINQNPKKYVINQNAVKADFPDKEINTLGQLKEAIANSVTTTTTAPTTEGETYTEEYLTATCQFTSRDLSLYFTKKGDKYALNQNFIKSILPNSDIQTVQDLVNALKDASYTEGYVMGLFGFTAQQTAKFFTVTGEGSNKQYTLNQTALKEEFPDKDIRTLGQLREAINGSSNDFSVGDTSDTTESTKYSEGILRGALGLSAAIVSEYFQKLNDGTYVLRQSVVKKRFPNDTITTAEELRDAIRAHKTVFASKGELMGRFGLSAFMVENFFKENADGTYSYDLEKMKYYFRDNQIPYTIENLKNADLYRSFWNQNYTKDSGYDIYTGAEFDNNVSGDELKKYLDAFRSVLTARYKEMYGFDDEYINKAFDTIFMQMNISNNSDYYLREVMTKFESDFYSYTRGGWGEWFDGLTPEMPKTYASGNYKTDKNGNVLYERKTYSSYGLTSKEMANWIMNNVNSSDPREQYQAKIFMDKFNELGLTGDEVYAFMDMLWRELAEKLGVTNTDKNTGDVRINLYDMAKLDANNDYSVLYELSKMIDEKTANIQHMSSWDIQNAETIDINELFKSSNNLNAEYIEEHLSEMLLSNDPGIRKLATMIQDLYNQSFGEYSVTYSDGTEGTQYRKYWAQTKEEKQERIKWLITLLNEQCGIQNPSGNPSTTNVGLTPELLNKLGDNVFDKVEEVINSQKLEKCLLADIDGVIDRFQQGGHGTGDCWLLSGIAAINATPAGKELFANAIKWNSDYTAITVTFPGTGDSVTITIDELLNADPDLGSDKYNNGDNDVLALVLAYEKLYGEINGDDGDTFFKKFLPNADHNKEKASGIDDLFAMIGSIFGGGGRVDLTEGHVKDYLQSILNAKKNGQNVAATFCLFTGGDTTFRWTTTDGEHKSNELDHGGMFDWGGHVYAITDITETTVTFINPWDSSKAYTVTWDEFASIGIGEMAWSTW